MQSTVKSTIQQQTLSFLNSVDSEFKELQGGTFVYLETGEFFTKAEHDKYIKKKLETYKVEMFATINQTVKNEKDIENEQSIVYKNLKQKKRTNNKLEYNGGNFNMVYKERLEEVSNMKLSNNEKLVFYVLRDYTAYPTNSIIINGKIPSMLELEPIIGLSERSIRQSLKSLEEKNLLKLVQSGHRKAIYMNPEYYASGKSLDADTLKMFNLVDCDDEKINSYL